MSDDEQGHTESNLTYPIEPSSLRKNGYVVIDGRACKIVSIKTSGGTISLAGNDVFTDQLHKCTLSTDETADIPHIFRHQYQLMNIDDGLLTLMAVDGVPKEDVKVPDGDLGSNLCSDFEEGKELVVVVQEAMGEKKAISYKEA